VRDRILTALYPLTKPGRAKPIVLMLLGPSGVGKTETARFINELLGGALMRKQLSMYHSEKFASYLFGGTHSEPSFAHNLLDRESGVILLDEFDKANIAFHSAFYQMFDDGVYEDKNYTAHLGPSLIICTTNYRSEPEAISSLGDALCSRFDAIIEYKRLPSESIQEIIDKMVDNRCSALTPGERDHFGDVQISAIKENLHRAATREGNVRRLGKLVDEVISLVLVRSMFQQG
jgi:ATP-dependent Clp protease ATP-binding subunit ClpA